MPEEEAVEGEAGEGLGHDAEVFLKSDPLQLVEPRWPVYADHPLTPAESVVRISAQT